MLKQLHCHKFFADVLLASVKSRGSWLLAPLVLCSMLFGQLTTSTIRGTAQDPSSALVGGASITLTNTDTNAKREVKTNNSGDFEISDLPRGTYRLTATAPGFKTYVASDIILGGSEVRRLSISFEIGVVGSEVTVSAGAAVIQSDGAKIQTQVDTSRQYDTPIVGGMASMDISNFILNAPLVSANGVWGSSWAGHASAQVQEGMDGHTNDDAVNQVGGVLDAQEITVVTVNNTAEFARVGFLNMITKSGSNQFHGMASYWNQNSAVGAREFFSDTKTKVLIHVGSASLGGPIKKDKLFFYASVHYQNIPSKSFYVRSVPTAQMRGGDFSQLLSSGITIKDPLSGLPFANNQIPINRIAGVSRAVTDQYLPAPNRGAAGDLGNNYSFVFPFPGDYHVRKEFSQRMDYQITSKNRIMGRLLEDWGLYALPSNYPAFTWTRTRFNVHMVIEDTHVFSPSLINTARFGFYKEKYTDGDPLFGVTPFKGDVAVAAIGLQGVNPKGYSAEGFPYLSIAGYSDMYTQAGGTVTDHDWAYADTVTWARGRHVLKMGGEFKPQTNYNALVPTNTYGNFNFNGSFSGYGYSDFLLGIPYNSTRLDPLTQRTRRDNELGLFVQDAWKVSNRLTVDMGLRWDRFGSPNYADGLMLNWDPASGNVIIPDGTQSSMSPLYPSTIKIVTGAVQMNPSKVNFVPRVGAAYRVTDNTVIRGGYGIFNETMGRYAYLQGGGPFQISETYQNVIANGAPLFTFPNPFPASLSLAGVPSQGVTGYPVDATNGKIHQYNLTLEHEFRHTGFRLSYVGSHDYGMHYNISVDKPQPSLIPFTADRRPYPQYSGASYYRNDGKAKFNAVTFEVTRKVGQFTFDSHYTLSSAYSNYSNLESPYAPLSFSRFYLTPRNRVVLNATWDIPVGKGRRYMSNGNPVLDGVLGGWHLYWMGYLESGQFFSPSFSGSDPSNTNTSGGLPDRICNGNLPANQRTVSHWFDASCFVAPPAGRLGNSGANVLEGPGFNNQNISIAKTFQIKERFKFTLTAAASDAFNHPNFTMPSANISSPGTVGIISGTQWNLGSRQVEFRGRLDF